VTEIITRNFGWKLISLQAAVALWMSVGTEPELSSFVTVPVEYKDIADDLEISSDTVETVYLELRGPSGEIGNFAGSKAAAILDMSGVQRPGQRTFTITEHSIPLPHGLRLVRSIPSQLRFDFERRATRSVPVQVRFSGTPQKGYEVARYEVNPSSLVIVGPESRVKKLDYAVTDPVDLSSVYGVSEFHTSTFIADPQVRFQSEPQVAVKVTMKKNQ